MTKISVKDFRGKCVGLLAGLASPNKSSLAFFICLLALTLVYRVQLENARLPGCMSGRDSEMS